MGDFFTGLVGIFMEGGTSYTAFWVLASMIISFALAFSGKKMLIYIMAATLLCSFISFFDLEFVYQTMAFVVIVIASAFYETSKNDKKDKNEEITTDGI